jgi:O-antigen/teichoic acid export membrane protein
MSFLMTLLGILLLVGLLGLQGGIACAIAQAKNRDGFEWFVIGAVLGLIGIIVVLCLPKLPADAPPRGYRPPKITCWEDGADYGCPGMMCFLPDRHEGEHVWTSD